MRKKLKAAREQAGYKTQQQFADALPIKVRRETVSEWETQDRGIRQDYQKDIRTLLGDDPHLFAIEKADKREPVAVETRSTGPLALPQNDTGLSVQEPCQTSPNRDILESSDPTTVYIPGSDKGFSFMDKLRRTIANAIGATLVGVNLQVILAPPVDAARTTSSVVAIDPEEYLDESTAHVKKCWQLMKTWQLDEAKALLNDDRRILTRLATTPFPHQGLAASLAFESEIMQIMIATHELDYTARENHCAQAVRFGRLSGNQDFVIAALGWQGNTYTGCYHQPQTAIRVLSDALIGLNSDVSPVNRSTTYIELAVAYAQDDNETEAEKYVALARMAMPTHPELDPFFRWIRIGQPELDEKEGRIHLCLAGQTYSRNHAQLAFDAFEKSISKQTRSQGNRGRALTRKAEAACALGDMRTFVESLEQGLHIAIQIDSKQQISQASDVISRVPPEWQRETSVQKLQGELNRALVVV
jgi:DNA-binding XRE family transcriptional regulator